MQGSSTDRTGSASRASWRTDPGTRVLAAGEDVLVRAGDAVVKCAGTGLLPLVAALLERTDGGVLEPVLFADLDQDQRDRADAVIDHLVEAGLLIETGAPGTADPVVLGLWRRSGRAVERAVIAERLRTATVRINGGGTLAARIRTEVAAAGLALAGEDDPAGVTVVVGEHEDDPVLADWNEQALADPDHGPWLAVTPYDGERAAVGPWIVPGESACHHCYRLRRAAVFPDAGLSVELPQARWLGPRLDAAAAAPGLVAVQTGLVLDWLLEYLALGDRSAQLVPGGVSTVELDLNGLRIGRHRVLRVPRCPRCAPGRDTGHPQVWFHQLLTAGSDGPA
ncbi:TOMM precursor leader peptide-binding protein [Crossiella sp. CA198]|uniref:TOMM precursor leader peptide-binding protein n=1 Tax=Crossiella sp. CA198 TaxID=3455607 RepID=UPI003F8D3218